jgi:hypothetical protein
VIELVLYWEDGKVGDGTYVGDGMDEMIGISPGFITNLLELLSRLLNLSPGLTPYPALLTSRNSPLHILHLSSTYHA